MRHVSAQAPNDGREDLPVAVIREASDHTRYQTSDSDAYADAELKLRKERTETMIRRAEEAAS